MRRRAFNVKELLVAIVVIGVLAVLFMRTERGLRQVPGRESNVGMLSQIAWSSDGKRLASVTFQGTIKIWDTADGAEILSAREATVARPMGVTGRMGTPSHWKCSAQACFRGLNSGTS